MEIVDRTNNNFETARAVFLSSNIQTKYSPKVVADLIIVPTPVLNSSEFLAWSSLYDEDEYCSDKRLFLEHLKRALEAGSQDLSFPWGVQKGDTSLAVIKKEIMDYASYSYLRLILMYFSWKRQNLNLVKSNFSEENQVVDYGPSLLSEDSSFEVFSKDLTVFKLFFDDLSLKRAEIVNKVCDTLAANQKKGKVPLIQSLVDIYISLGSTTCPFGDFVRLQNLYVQFLEADSEEVRMAITKQDSFGVNELNSDLDSLNEMLLNSLVSFCNQRSIPLSKGKISKTARQYLNKDGNPSQVLKSNGKSYKESRIRAHLSKILDLNIL